MSRILFLIGTGGFLGSIARYLTASTITKYYSAAFPYGTFAANVIGCLIIGIVFGLSDRFNWLTPEWRFFLATGFCGGYTTFSSFAIENVKLLQDGNYITFATYSSASFAVGLLAVFIGLSLTKI
ncbi:MAG: fluoride efflux transporter CrcB [Chitinophagales bacterium]|nr:fluoride efflux transporter CrcB [Chitinophagales bacterium]